jgi:hypothetical protein
MVVSLQTFSLKTRITASAPLNPSLMKSRDGNRWYTRRSSRGTVQCGQPLHHPQRCLTTSSKPSLRVSVGPSVRPSIHPTHTSTTHSPHSAHTHPTHYMPPRKCCAWGASQRPRSVRNPVPCPTNGRRLRTICLLIRRQELSHVVEDTVPVDGVALCSCQVDSGAVQTPPNLALSSKLQWPGGTRCFETVRIVSLCMRACGQCQCVCVCV